MGATLSPHDNVGPPLLKVGWTLAAISTIIVGARFYTRIFRVSGLKPDDYTMLLSLIMGIVNTSFVNISVNWGLGRHFVLLDTEQQTEAVKWDYLAQPTAIMGPAVGRISFALLLLSVIGNRKERRWFLYGIMITQFVINSLTFIFILVQCKPIQALWDHSIKGDCWDLRVQEYFGFFQGSFNSVTDFILAIFPAFVVWHLNMKLSMKISLIILMGLGIFAMAGSVVKTVLLKSVGNQGDYTYNTSFLIIWWTVELYLVIIAASIPTLKPLLAKNKATGTSTAQKSYGLRSFGSRKTGSSRLSDERYGLSSVFEQGPKYSINSVSENRSSQEQILHISTTDDHNEIRRTMEVSVDVQKTSSTRPPQQQPDFMV